MGSEGIEVKKRRIAVLDELMGLAVLCMIFYHGFFVAYSVFGLEVFGKLFDFFTPAEPFFAGIFIVVSGISSRLSRSNFKRGLRLLAVALGLSAVSILLLPALGFKGTQIYFGILHLLSVSMLFWALIHKAAEKINPFISVTVCVLLYLFTFNISRAYLGFGDFAVIRLPEKLYETDYLMPFGLFSEKFFSADYFPLLPNVFLFLAGAFFGELFMGELPEFVYKTRFRILSFLGRRAIYVYILHIPIIYLLIRFILLFI